MKVAVGLFAASESRLNMNSKMLVYLLKRIGLAILTVWAVITITFTGVLPKERHWPT